jgi:hypothetical protein
MTLLTFLRNKVTAGTGSATFTLTASSGGSRLGTSDGRAGLLLLLGRNAPTTDARSGTGSASFTLTASSTGSGSNAPSVRVGGGWHYVDPPIRRGHGTAAHVLTASSTGFGSTPARRRRQEDELLLIGAL